MLKSLSRLNGINKKKTHFENLKIKRKLFISMYKNNIYFDFNKSKTNKKKKKSVEINK